ncbi:MAG: ribosome silencing factor [Clostridiaceae bacterium]|nr:ribosome silencing factor [Clostridiaceae bacterium]
MAAVAAKAIEEKKGRDVEILKVTSKTTLADVFVLASGTSGIHVKTLAESVEEKLEQEFGLRPNHIEGLENRNWVLLDYRDLIIHVLMPEDRAHYKLENLWRVDVDKRPV